METQEQKTDKQKIWDEMKEAQDNGYVFVPMVNDELNKDQNE